MTAVAAAGVVVVAAVEMFWTVWGVGSKKGHNISKVLIHKKHENDKDKDDEHKDDTDHSDDDGGGGCSGIDGVQRW